MIGHSEDLIAQVCCYLDSQQWHYKRHGDKNILELGMNLKCKLNSCKIFIDVRDDYILTYAVSPINATEDVRPVVAEYITRANYGLKSGNFEMDYRDGEVRYKTYLRCSIEVPPLEDVEHSVDLPIAMMQRYGDGLVKCMMGFGNPEKDIEAAEAEG